MKYYYGCYNPISEAIGSLRTSGIISSAQYRSLRGMILSGNGPEVRTFVLKKAQSHTRYPEMEDGCEAGVLYF
jgi:hypothetical protein